MKKLVLPLLAVATGLAGLGTADAQLLRNAPSGKAMADVQSAVSVHRDAQFKSPGVPSNMRTAMTPPPPPDWGSEIGWTFRDQQYFGSPASTVARFPNGAVTAIWRYSNNRTLTGNLLGYNSTNAAGVWNHWAVNGLADSMRTIYTQPTTGNLVIPTRMPWVPATGVTLRDGASSFTGTGTAAVFMGDNLERGDWRTPSVTVAPNGDEVVSFFSFLRTGPNPLTTPVASVVTERNMATGRRPDNNPNTALVGTTGLFRGLERQRHDMIDARTDAGTNGIFQVGYTTGNLQFMGNMDDTSGVVDPIYVLRSVDNGASWQRISLPSLTTKAGLSAVAGYSQAIAVRGNTVAVAANVIYGKPRFAMATQLWKSTDNGNTWATSFIDQVTGLDTNKFIALTGANAGNYFVELNDGCNSLAIDNAGLVHFASGRGFAFADTTAAEFGSLWFNAGINPNFGGILYWNETEAGRSPRVVANVVTNNVVIPATSAANGPGTYGQATTSMPNLAIDQNNNIFIIYSGVIGGTEVAVGRVSRDILSVVSINGGKTFSRVHNVAGRAGGFDDGSGGSSALEDAWPMAPRTIAADGLLPITWYMDNRPGSIGTQTGRHTVGSGSMLASMINTRQLSRIDIASEFPDAACGGSSFTVNITLPPGITYPANNTFIIEFDTATVTAPFTTTAPGYRSLGVLNGTSGGVITGLAPTGFPAGRYSVRVRATGIAGTDTTGGKVSPTYTMAVTGAIPNVVMAAPSILPVANRPNGVLELCAAGDVNLTADITSGGGFSEIDWTVTPTNAGTVRRSSGTTAVLTIAPTYLGSLTVTSTAKNGCGSGTPSPARTISVVPNPYTIGFTGAWPNSRVTFTGTQPVAGTNITYILTYVNAASGAVVRSVATNALNPANYNISSVIPVGTTAASVTIQVQIGDCYSNVLSIPTTISPLAKEFLQARLLVFPNPAKDKFVVGLTGDNGAVTAQVYNAMGQLVTSKVLAQETEGAAAEFSTSAMPAGIYTVRVVTTAGIKTSRLVID